jgi:hypothetical protein
VRGEQNQDLVTVEEHGRLGTCRRALGGLRSCLDFIKASTMSMHTGTLSKGNEPWVKKFPKPTFFAKEEHDAIRVPIERTKARATRRGCLCIHTSRKCFRLNVAKFLGFRV